MDRFLRSHGENGEKDIKRTRFHRLQLSRLMAAKKNIMTAIKRAVSPLRQATTVAELQLPPSNPTGLPATTPFTRYVLDNLNLQNGEHKLFAMTFAPQIQIDCEAKVLDFDDYFHLLGHANKASALRTLLRTVPKDELVINKDVENSMGRPRDVYLLNVNQIEEVLLAANTDEGKKWRKLVLKIKNLVVQFMKMEMEAAANMAAEKEKLAQQQLEESDAKRAELETVQAKLQATIESQRKREEKKEARKRQQKEPLETAYIMTNMPDDNQGPYKCGKTGGDAKKRAKEMQTGNHEAMRVIASAKCMNSKVVEDVMFQIFRDYRTNDKLEWFDTNLTSMKSVLNFVVRVIDGLNCVNHDEISVEKALEAVLRLMDETIFAPSSGNPSTAGKAGEKSFKQEEVSSATNLLNTEVDELLSIGTQIVGQELADRIEHWLVEHIRTDKLPGIILSRKLTRLLMKDEREVIQPNSVTGQLRRYEGAGVIFPKHQRWIGKEKGRAIMFQKDRLQETFIKSGHLQV